jgi:uncharacterized protein (TIGR02246 family)
MVQQASDVRAEIDRVNQRFVEAWNRGDVGGAMTVYTDDATILPPGAPRVSGRGPIQQFWQGVQDSGVRAVALQTDDLEVADSGDLACEIGTATLTVRPDGGTEQTMTAKFVVVWKRRGDEWRWHTDIWNADE